MRFIITGIFCLALLPLIAQNDNKEQIIFDDSITLDKEESNMRLLKDSTGREKIKELIKNQPMPSDSLIPVNKKKCKLEAMLLPASPSAKHEDYIC